jgi:hypothetical protein
MEETVTHSERVHAQPQTRITPSSSRMLATYLADIETLLDQRRWDVALRDACDLPQIAVALADPGLRSSGERCREWCACWISPSEAYAGSDIDYDSVRNKLVERTKSDLNVESIPSQPLRRLRLRRHARSTPHGFSGGQIITGQLKLNNQGAAETIAMCTAIVEGVRRWYAHFACHDATAQVNLARLAVLR